MFRRLLSAVSGADPGGASADEDAWLVAGLGNPGPAYAGNRHNIGFQVADLLATRIGARFRRHRRVVADVAEGWLDAGGVGGMSSGPRLVLAKPMTYMNLSGGPVAGLARYYGIQPDRVVAVHDELDLPFGTLRAKQGGGEGGHNGLRSLSQSLRTKDYLRVRFGVGRPPGRRDPIDWLLSDFTAAERKEVDYLVDRTADFVTEIITKGLEPAQNVYHAA